MDHTDTKWISAGGYGLEFYGLRSLHIRQLNVKFRPSSNGESFDMSYDAIEKSNTHVRPQPEVSFSISKERYLVLMRSIGDGQNVESTCLQYLWPSDKLDSVFPDLFLSCSEGFTKLCQALCTNSTMSTLQIQLSGKALDALALSQAFDTNVSSLSQLIKEIVFLLFHNKVLQTIQIQVDNNSDQDWVKLVRPLKGDLDVQQPNVDLTKLNLTVQGSRTSALMCALVFHEVVQSSTQRKLTLETSDHYGNVLEFSCNALVRPLVVDEDGHQANVTLTKINHDVSVKASPAMLAEILPEMLRRNSTLKELTLEISVSCCDVLEGSPRCALVQALFRTLIGDPEGQMANVTLAKLNLADEVFQNQVVLVRPPQEDQDAQEANLDLTKLNVRVLNSGMSAAICPLIFHEVLQSSTLQEFTVANLNYYSHMVEGSPSYALIQALVRSLIMDADGPQANASFTKLNLAYHRFHDRVTLVRPLTTESDGQQSHVDLAKLRVTISEGAVSAVVCNPSFHEVLQSSTPKELTVETSDYYEDMLDSSPNCALLQALVRPLIADEAGQESKVNLSKLTLVLPHVRVNRSLSHAIFGDILPKLLQRSSTLKELTVKASHVYEEGEETREEKLCALLQSLKENKSLEILDLSECQGILTQKVITTLMDILLVNFNLRDIKFGDSSILVDSSHQTQIMDHTDTKWISAGGYGLEFYGLWSLHIRQLNVKFRPSSNGESFDMSYDAIEKSNTHVRPQPEVSFSISKERYLVLMRSIGDGQNVESTCLQYLWPSDKLDSVFPDLFLSCSEGFTKLCQALCTNSTMSTLQIQLSGKALDALALSQAFDTNVSSLSQLIKEIVFLLFHNKVLQTIQIQVDNNSDQDWVKLVRPLKGDLDVQQPNVDLTKLNLTVQGSRTSALMCALVFHEVVQSSTQRKLTLETSDHYGNVLEFSCNALVRPLVVDEDGHQANVTLTKINHDVSVKASPAMLAEILPEMLRRNSTLKELTLEISVSCCDVLEGSPRCALVQALFRTLIGDPEGQMANVTLAKLNLADEVFQNQVVLVRPPQEDQDAQEANLDLTKLNVRVLNSGMSAAICPLIFHEVLQSSTLQEFTVANLNYYSHMVEGSPSYALIQALVRSLIMDADGPQANASFTKLNLAYHRFHDRVTLVRPLTTESDGQQSHVDLAKLRVTISEGAVSAVVCNPSFHEVLQSSTPKELTVETSDYYEDMLDSSPNCALLQALVRPLIADEAGQESKVNLSKLTLVLPHVRVNRSLSHAIFGDILPKLLQRSSTLKELTVKASHVYEEGEETREEKLCALLQSLKENKSLEILDLSECQGILTQKVIPTLMDILLVNFNLRDINFGDSSIWYSVKEQLRMNEKYRQSCLRKLPVAKAQAARVFLCGGPYAGKTTLRKVLIRCSKPGSKFRKTYLSPCKDLVVKSHDGIQKLLHGPFQLALRTRGIEICGLKNNAGIRLSIWDMGGQEEYHAFHDFMFPNLSDTGNPSSFLVVCSPFTSVHMNAKKQPEEIYQELEYWLRFIASNTRKSISFKPKVVVVLTHADKVAGLATWTKGLVTRLQRNFGDALDLSPEPIAVDARSSHSSNSIACLIQDNTQAILEKLPPVYEVCSVMRLVLADWRLQHPECPLISWQTFSDLCQDAQVPDLITSFEGFGTEYLLVEERRKAVAECLHDAGDIIFFNDFDFIVVDLHWFCHRVMGHLIRLSHDKFKDHSSMGSPADGFTTREYLEAILNDSLKTSRDLGRHGGSMQGVKAETLVKLMLRLELCFERTTGSLDDGLFIPMTLARESECLWHWPTSNHNFQCNITKHFGRRLQCDDQNCTFIPPGLFCRLQVSLRNKFLGPSNHMTADYFLQKNLILIVFNGVEIVLEYHGNVGTHIDVLVRSNSMSFDAALEIVHKYIMTHIQELCVSSGGCQGVLLVEGIVRPECVRKQMSFMQRQNQGVLVEDLKHAIEASGSRMYQHTWSQLKEGDRVILDSGCEAAMDLLGSKEKEDVKRRLHELEHSKGYDHTMNPLGGLTSSILEAQDSTFPKPMFYGESSKVPVPSSGDNRSNVQCLLPQGPTSSHPDICQIANRVIDFFVKSSQRQVPRIVLFTTDDASMKQILITNLVPGMKALQLHLLCEYKTQVHIVEGQRGCEVILEGKQWEKIHGLVVEGLKWVFLAIKVGAQITMGIGDLVPNPSKAYAKAVSDSVGSCLPMDWATVTPEELEMDAASAMRTAQKESAEQWLVDFLKDKSILKDFGLQRVIYKDEQAEVGWICEKHLKEGLQCGELARLPHGGMGL